MVNRQVAGTPGGDVRGSLFVVPVDMKWNVFYNDTEDFELEIQSYKIP